MARLLNYAVTGLYGPRGATLDLNIGVPVVIPAEIQITSQPIEVNEGSSVTVSLRLRTQPTGSVVVTATSDDTSALAPAATDSVTFTTANWHTAQSISLDAPAEMDFDDESVTITLTAVGADYDGLSTSFAITVTDVGQLFYWWDANSPQGAPASGSGAITAATISGDTDLWLTLTQSVGSDTVIVTLSNSDDTAITLESNVGASQFNDRRLNSYTNANWNVRGGGHSFEVTPATGSSVGDTSTITATVTSTGSSIFDNHTATIVLTVGS